MTPIKVWLNNLEKALIEGRITPATRIDEDTLVVAKNIENNSIFAGEFNNLPQSHKDFYLNMRPKDICQNVKIIAVFDIWDVENLNTKKEFKQFT